MAAAASFARRSAAIRLSFRPSVPRSSSSHARQLPQHLPPSRSASFRFSSSFRRESSALFSMLPVHSAIASARLVSRIPCEPCSCAESRFFSYVSPI